jgi:ssDNA thymidine ADP-ribosyltransferase, DarT
VDGSTARSPSSHFIVHFTHVSNLPGILAAGCIQSDKLVGRGLGLQVEAADLGIKASRRTIPVPLAPFGYVADYVPFYFASRSPMLYKIFRGGLPNYTEGQDPLIYLVSTVEAVVQAGLPWLFSDGNCAATVTQVFDDLSQLDIVVDWQVMRAQMWNNTAEDPDRMRRRMAEFLVHERIPVGCLAGVVVRTHALKQQIEAILAAYHSRLPVRVQPGWYF